MKNLFALVLGATLSLQAATPELKLAGDWAVQVALPKESRTFGRPPQIRWTTLHVTPPMLVTVTAERYDSLPVFNPNTGGWVKGAQLHGVRAQETTTPFLLDPSSLVIRSGIDTTSETFEAGKDYSVDLDWGTVGRLEGGRIKEGQRVYASYRHALLRLDSVVLTQRGKMELRRGVPQSAAPSAPQIAAKERLLGNIWLPGRISKLAPEHLFRVLEATYPEPPKPSPTIAEKLLPKTLAKLNSYASVRVLAWGDSVTDGSYVPSPDRFRWQEQFVARLRKAFPKAKIELITEAWGGRNTSSYLAEPPGSPHNYREKVLAAAPDLIVSEFVNDAWMNPEQVEQQYSKLLADFQGIGADWVILTPHYVRPDWMGISRENDIDQDPRPYVTGLRQFAQRHSVALADASLRYGHLWREGIPYTTLMLNSINHPDARGMKLFADALMELWP